MALHHHIGAFDRRLYSDGDRMLLVTKNPDGALDEIQIEAFTVGPLSYQEEVIELVGNPWEFVTQHVGRRCMEFEISSRGALAFRRLPAGASPAADFLPARALSIEQLLAIVHRKMRDRGEDLGAALARLPAA